MSEVPRISIITPSFNQGRFLEKAILSVLAQNYPNLEYIIIDGGSTDSSVEIINKYRKKLTYCVSEPDNGQSHAINKGFKIATGDYVGWLNSDDELAEKALEILAETVLKNQSQRKKMVLYYGLLQIVDPKGNHIRFEPFNERLTFRNHLYAEAPCLQPGSFYARDALARVRFLDESLHYCMDWDLWLKLLETGESQFIPHIMAKLRVHPESKSSNKKIDAIKESYRVFRTHGGSYVSSEFLRYLLIFTRYYLTGRVTKTG